MFTIVLILALAGAILAAGAGLQRPTVDHRLTALLLFSYAIRLAIAPLTVGLSVFASAPTDYGGYEGRGEVIAHLWHYTGIHYVDTDEMPSLAGVSLPSNLFAFVIYLNGQPTHLGCTAVVAAVACFTCLNVYLLAQLLGAGRNAALGTAAIVSLFPSFLFYTSNTFKDGFVVFLMIGILGCAIRLARTFSVVQLALAVLFLVFLWFTRFYLVFIVPAPLLLGLLGLRSRSILRIILMLLLMLASVAALYAYSETPDVVVHRATRTFDIATSENVLSANAEGGSGVTIESASPTGAFALKLLYTLFAPFPWQSGSIALQIGKVELLIWYYFMYRALLAGKIMWRDRRSDLFIFTSFLVPLTVAYALSFSNIGLIVRQRMGIALVTMLLAAVSWGRQKESSPRRLPARAHVTRATT
jgi:hypothetical protein